jgi:tetratricopeptide (TPR) repeat protein
MSIQLRRFRFALFGLVAVFVIVTFRGVPSVSAGESQWVEVRSPNFSVVTDAGEKRGREVAMHFEQMRAVFGALMTKAKVNLAIPLQIVAFRNNKEMRQFAPLFNGKPIELAGLFQQGSDRSFVLLDMSVENPWTVVFHEYAHQLLNGNLQAETDPWFEEGFAEYFSSIEVDSKEARVGKIPNDTYVILQQVGMMKIADLFKVQQNSKTYNESGDHRTTFYAESSMLVHYLYDNQFMPKAATYFDLEKNKHIPVEDAIQQAFGMGPAQFDKTLRNYVSGSHNRYYPIPNPPGIAANNYTSAPLNAAAGNAVLADLHLHSRDYQERAVSEFQDILKSDPNNAAACRGLGYAYLQKQDLTQAEEYFKRASQLDARDPRVHYYNAMLMAREGGFGSGSNASAMIRELETSISLDANFADSYALLSFAQSTAGEPAEALATMRKALAINPRNENYLYNLANLYLANRQPDEAIALLRSLHVTDNPALATQVDTMLQQALQFKEVLQQARSANAGSVLVVRSEPPGNPGNTPAGAKTPTGPVKFISGTLTHVDCSNSALASFTLVAAAKTWKMSVTDRNHLVLIGADAFSCDWSKQKVAVNYRETSEGEGSVVSLEIQ